MIPVLFRSRNSCVQSRNTIQRYLRLYVIIEIPFFYPFRYKGQHQGPVVISSAVDGGILQLGIIIIQIVKEGVARAKILAKGRPKQDEQFIYNAVFRTHYQL